MVVRHEVAPFEYGGGKAAIRLVSEPVPNPDARRRQRWGVKLGVTPKGRVNHPPGPGQGKTGMVNASEPSMRLRHPGSPKAMVVAANDGPGHGTQRGPMQARAGYPPPWEDTTAPEYRGRLPQSHLSGAERGNPVGVWSRDRAKSGRPVRQTQGRRNSPAGQDGLRSECHQAERRREFITGWIGQYPRRKAADVGRVNRPVDAAQIAHRGRS